MIASDATHPEPPAEHGRRPSVRRRRGWVVGACAAMTLAAAACGSGSGGGSSATDAASTSIAVASAGGGTLKLLAYDAFVAHDALKQFTAKTGIKVEVLKGGDTGTMVNKAILTAGKPEADVMWGLDNTFLSRAQRSNAPLERVVNELHGLFHYAIGNAGTQSVGNGRTQ